MLQQTATTQGRTHPQPVLQHAADANPRLRVQETARRTKRRHFTRAVYRVAVLTSLDAAVLIAAREFLHLLRGWEWSIGLVGTLFPSGFMGGWGSLAAFGVGLALAGAYASEERWASPSAVFRGVAMGSALALWQSIDTAGIAWTAGRWIAVLIAVGASVTAARVALGFLVVRWRMAEKPVDRAILVGDPSGPHGRKGADLVLKRPGMQLVGWLCERGDVKDYLGHPSAVWEVLCQTGTDTVVLCGDVDKEMFDSVVEAAAVAGCRVLSIRRQGILTTARPQLLGKAGLRVLELTFPAARAGQDVVKRLLDIVASVTLLAVQLPLLGLISLAIKIDSAGPVLFIQDRVGQAGRVFPMWKFRTMSNGADGKKDELAHLNSSGDPRLFKIPNDPRVTRVGAFLRRWSMDEIPQLWNVLRGQMSLVGPRPFFESDMAAYDDHHFIRLTLKPGLTGLWQTRGRSSIVDFEEVVRLDREYVETWSFGLDVKILLATLPAVIRRTGAY